MPQVLETVNISGATIQLHTPADKVLFYLRRFNVEPLRKPEIIDKDEKGSIVEWYLPGYVFVFKRYSHNGEYECYRVCEMRAADEQGE